MTTTHPTGKLLLSVITVASVAGLSGCAVTQAEIKAGTQYDVTQRRAAAATNEGPTVAEQGGPYVRGGKLDQDIRAGKQRDMPVARRAAAPFIGSTMVPVTTEDKLPSIFFEPFTLDFTDAARGGAVSLQTAMARVSKLAGVPIRLQSDVLSVPARPGSNAPQRLASFPPPVPPAGTALPSPVLVNGGASAPPQPVAAPPGTVRAVGDAVSAIEPVTLDNVEMRYQGTLAGYLNHVTDTLGLAWEYRDSTVVIMRFVDELHEIFSFAGESKYSMSSAGTGSGAGTNSGASNAASASLEVAERGDSNPVASIEKSIMQMVSGVPGSAVTRTDGSGRLLVKTSREMQSRVRDYIQKENNAMRRQASIQFDIYSITTEEGDERGVNWTAILEKAGEAVRGTLVAPASLATNQVGTATLSILPNVADSTISKLLGNSALFLQSLNSQGYSAQHRPVSLLALNRQWGRISRMSTEYYLSETTPGPASSTGVGAPGLKTDKVTTGDQYVAMPQILDDNTVLLKFGLSLSDLLGLFDVSVGSGQLQQKVQAPKVNAVNAQFPVAIRPGEVVAVTGLTRTVASSDDRRLVDGAPLLAGGSKKVSYKREHFIIFIRPTLL